jgi:hypothetical protein
MLDRSFSPISESYAENDDFVEAVKRLPRLMTRKEVMELLGSSVWPDRV